jgi:hypothetical protein
VSDFFRRALQQQKWETGIAKDEDHAALWTMFKHAFIEAGCSVEDVENAAGFALASLLSTAVDRNAVRLSARVRVSLKPEDLELDPEVDYSEEPWLSNAEQFKLSVRPYRDAVDMDGNDFALWQNGGNNLSASVDEGDLFTAGNIVVHWMGFSFGPQGWLKEQGVDDSSEP